MCASRKFSNRCFPEMFAANPFLFYLHVLDYTLSFMWQSSNSERAGSHINKVKTLHRTELSSYSLNSLVFGTFNDVAVQFIDTARLNSRWRSEGHIGGTTTSSLSSTEKGKAKVFKALLKDKKGRFSLSKEGPFVQK